MHCKHRTSLLMYFISILVIVSSLKECQPPYAPSQHCITLEIGIREFQMTPDHLLSRRAARFDRRLCVLMTGKDFLRSSLFLLICKEPHMHNHCHMHRLDLLQVCLVIISLTRDMNGVESYRK